MGESGIPPLEVALQAMRESLSRLEDPELTQAGAFIHFSHFVMRSAQARNLFIRQFTARTGKKAKQWSQELWLSDLADRPVAELFHELRVDDFHSEPFVIEIVEESTFAVPINGTIAELKTCPNRLQATLASALFGESKGPGLRIYVNGTTGAQDGDPVDVVDYRRRYVVGSVSGKVSRLIAATGTEDIVDLARRQMRSIETYRQWFDETYPRERA
jgi:hypothetical protein